MAKQTVPAHVPAHLIHSFDLFADPCSLDGVVQSSYTALHGNAPDVFFTPSGGHWVATRHADATLIMTTPEVFSSVKVNFPPSPSFFSIRLPPQDLDAPEHMRYRLMLLKFLAPKEVRKLEMAIRERIGRLIDDVVENNGCEFVHAVAVPFPVQTFMDMMQWDESRFRQLVRWANAILGADNMLFALPAFLRMSHFLKGEIRRRKRNPGNDPISLILASQVDGAPIPDKRVLEICNLLFLAGLDTVTNAMTYLTKHLAEHPADQQRLRDDPTTIPAAVEELMRRYTFVNIPRRVTRDYTLNGAPLRKGDLIVAALAAASNDSRAVQNPEEVDFDRKRVQHFGFNSGPHACAGATLARLELRVFLEEWLKRVPAFTLAPDHRTKGRGGPVMAIESLKLAW